MRMLMVSPAALGALTFPAAAQNTVRSAESPQMDLSAAVNPGRLDDFRQLVAEVVANTEKERKTLEYQYTLSPDQKSIDIVERYVDSSGVVTHADGFKAKFGKRFMEDMTPAHFAVYGPVSAEAKEALAAFNPVYMSPIDGFVR